MEQFVDRDQQIREKSFLLVVPLFASAGLLWALIYYYFGAKHAALIPGSYSVLAFSSLLFFRWHKNFPVFRTIQLVLILVLPFLLHLSLGGFISSSAVILWSTLCPLGALAFHNSKAAVYWIILFLMLVVATIFMGNKIFPEDIKLPATLINIFFVMNISAVTFLNFYVMKYFVNQNELVKARLKEEQELLAIEREKSEKLLLNILPSPIAKRLKDGERVIANEYPEAACAFCRYCWVYPHHPTYTTSHSH